jgi:hypothetical protein
MKIILKYQKLPKPRGSWWWGVSWLFTAKYTDKEFAEFNPTWTFSINGKEELKYSNTAKGGNYPATISFTVQPNYLLPAYNKPNGDTWFFRTQNDRTAFITMLHKMRDHAVEAHKAWWAANPPDEGDKEDNFSLVLCDGDSITTLEGDAAQAADRLT